jgi:hypothetical protein
MRDASVLISSYILYIPPPPQKIPPIPYIPYIPYIPPIPYIGKAIRYARGIGADVFLKPKDICDGNKKLNTRYVYVYVYILTCIY